jgi:hypothetical protein
MNSFGKYAKTGLPMLRIVFLGCGLTQSLSNKRVAFVWLFNAHALNQASLFRGFALKKPITL